MVGTGTNTFTSFWTVLKSTVMLIFYLIFLPLKMLNIMLSMLWLPFYVVSQTLSLITNILYLIFLIYIMQRIFGFQVPPSLMNFVSDTMSWIFPGFLVLPPTAINTDIFTGRSVQQIAEMLKKSKLQQTLFRFLLIILSWTVFITSL